MSITLLNPEGLTKVDAYWQVAVATGSKHVFIAGQVGWDSDGATIGDGDFAAQVEQSFLNVVTALDGAGGSLDDLAKLTFYAVDWTPDKMPLLFEGLTRAFATLGIEPITLPPSSLIGVATLDVPEHLVEIEAVAVID